MPYAFNDASQYAYKPGSLFLGLDDRGKEIGVQTERHAITIAGAGAGKGAALIIPNLLRWTHNALVIDPKGENAEQTWQAREAMGQAVYVVDPFKVAEVPDRLRASFNPLASIQPDGFASREDLAVIADGMVKSHDPKHMEWVEGARDILAGVMAYVVADAPPEHRNFAAVRRFLLQPNELPADEDGNPRGLYADAQRMLDCDACGGLAKAAGLTIITAIESEKGMERDFLGGARRSTKWIDSPAMAGVLSASSFDLSELKTGTTSVYLVLPPHYIETHSAFLRLFVRCGINAMAAGGSGKGKRCLFLLDEFFSLGRIDEIAKAAGLMRSYGVHLWPFLQDLGQLQLLYGKEGAETFFDNADAHVFFGNSGMMTLEYISQRLGKLTPNEVAPNVPQQRQPWWPTPDELRNEQLRHANETAYYQHNLKRAGSPRLDASEIKELVGKKDTDKVARNMLVFAKGGDVLKLRLAPYFQPPPLPQSSQPLRVTTSVYRFDHTFNVIRILSYSMIFVIIWRGHNNTAAFFLIVMMIAAEFLHFIGRIRGEN